jgi:predicted DNA-binding transcriptional regulator YafY
MERTERFYRIQSLLRSRHFVSTQDFMGELGVSRATFKRDLEYLRDRMHAPIVFDRDREAYSFDPKVADSELWQLPGLWFSADELLALLTMDSLLGDLQPGVLGEMIAPLRKRLRALLDSGEHSADAIARRIRILTMGARRIAPTQFRTLATAVLTRKRVRLRHQRRPSGEVLEREVSPQRLVHYRDNWYVDAYCHERQALRTFGLDAIEAATVLEHDAQEIADAVLEAHYASGYGIFGGTATHEAVLRFAPASARWVARETWHPGQTGTSHPDGSYELRLPYAQEPELIMDILKHGADVQVLTPQSLRAAVADRLRAATKLYD